MHSCAALARACPLPSARPGHAALAHAHHATPHPSPAPCPRPHPPGIIVDPSFREAFRIAPATPGYARLVEALPETYIGDACTLRRLVALVTAQAARSYEAQGLTQPPWRRFSAMMARWAPPRARYTDTVVTPPSSPLKRMGSEDAARLAFATADAAARGAVARLAGAGLGARVRVPAEAAAPPARVVRGFDLPAAPPAVAVA